MKQCAKCGYTPPRCDARFCGKCGSQLAENSQSQETAIRTGGASSTTERRTDRGDELSAATLVAKEFKKARRQVTAGAFTLLVALAGSLWTNSYYHSLAGVLAVENGDDTYYKLVFVWGAVALLGIIRLVSGLASEFKG
jgi:uncharacterized membrane protein YvbJ